MVWHGEYFGKITKCKNQSFGTCPKNQGISFSGTKAAGGPAPQTARSNSPGSQFPSYSILVNPPGSQFPRYSILVNPPGSYFPRLSISICFQDFQDSRIPIRADIHNYLFSRVPNPNIVQKYIITYFICFRLIQQRNVKSNYK